MSGMYAQHLPVLSFRLGEQRYALMIDDVVEVAAMVALAPVPDAPPHLLGVANRHGEVLPMLDLRLMFGLIPQPIDAATLFIVVQYEGQITGLVVDEINQVEYIEEIWLREAPAAGRYVDKIVSHDDQLIQIITLRSLLVGPLPDAVDDPEFFEGGSTP